MSFYHLPPQNYLEEQILLGMLLINPTLFPAIIPLITIESFFLEENQIIYENLLILYKKNKLYPMEILYSLAYNENLTTVGGIEKILDLMKQSQLFTISINLSRYAEDLIQDINNNHTKRLMIQYAYNLIKLAHVRSFPSHQLYNRASNYLDTTSRQIPKENIIDFKELIGKFLLRIEEPNNEENAIKTINLNKKKILSGFSHLDKLTNGIPRGDLFVIAGRPSMGKTSLAINMIYNIFKTLNIGISIFSLEMSKMQILIKLISIASKVPANNINSNNINKNSWTHIINTCKELITSNIYLNDTPEMSIDYIQYTSKLLQKETRYVEIIIIDYLQLIQVEEFDYSTRTQELSYITRKLKLLAQALDIPLIILSQLNRSIETRINKSPLLSDLKESGCLNREQKLNIDLINNLNIANIFENININQKNIIKSTNIDLLITKKSNTKISLYILIHYLYQIKINLENNIQIDTTYNHRIYNKNRWVKVNNFLDHIMIVQQYYYCKNKTILENFYIKQIDFKIKKQVYDLTAFNSLSFISQKIILHNSIEQDADIVIILYQKEKVDDSSISEKIIDMCLCKNRNGPTGYFQLLFSLQNTIFSDLEISNISN